MLDSVTLNFTDSLPLTLPTKGITIFVGPNNSGKSLVLREVEQIFQDYNKPRTIIADYDYSFPKQDQLEVIISDLKRIAFDGVESGNLIISRVHPNDGRKVVSVNIRHLRGLLRDFSSSSSEERHYWLSAVESWGVLRLDGRSRFNLTNDKPGGDLLGDPENILAYLFKNDSIRLKVYKIIKEAFGLHFVIDPTNLGQLRIRLSSNPPLANEQSLNQEARDYHRDATHIKDASDGVQAYTGIITAVMSGDYHTVLVDEPEAFLHPPLAKNLGKNLTALTKERRSSLMASTHSSDFLMGCVTATKGVRVVRLEYRDGKSRGKMVDPQQLEAMFQRPLMRSANVISALFHDGVVVTESDNDRAFYSEIYHRITLNQDDAPSILFINAQNKQTTKDIVGPLRQFGVPAVAITDIDIVKDGGSVWSSWLSTAQIPNALHLGFGQQRSSIHDRLRQTGKDMKCDGGIEILDQADRKAAEYLFNNLVSFGIFVVQRGELENWLPELQISGKKTDWAVAMLERLGNDPDATTYVHPGSDDVWQFMRNIIDWVKNPTRQGMP